MVLKDLSQEQLIALVEKLQSKPKGRNGIVVHALGTVRKGKVNGKETMVPCKGNISVYGLGRFPVTLYASQWERLLDLGDDIRQAIADNRDVLASKEED
jgi:hypothetical protein